MSIDKDRLAWARDAMNEYRDRYNVATTPALREHYRDVLGWWAREVARLLYGPECEQVERGLQVAARIVNNHRACATIAHRKGDYSDWSYHMAKCKEWKRRFIEYQSRHTLLLTRLS